MTGVGDTWSGVVDLGGGTGTYSFDGVVDKIDFEYGLDGSVTMTITVVQTPVHITVSGGWAADDLTSSTEDCTVSDMTTDAMSEDEVSVALAEAAEAEDEVGALVDWLATQTWSDFAQSLAKFYKDRGFLSPKQEAAARSMMSKVESKKTSFVTATETTVVSEPAAPAYEPAEGEIHSIDGKIYRVRATRKSYYKASRLFAHRADIHEVHGFDDKVEVTWTYVGKKPWPLFSAATLLTWEQARDFGCLTNQCIRCGRSLDDVRSVAAAYGKVCAGHMGWFYPTMAEALDIIATRTKKEVTV